MELKEAAEKHPISESAVRGGELFFSDKAGCTACHLGANFTDEKYHNLGVGMDAEEPDLGRFVVTKDEKDKGAFKTPTVPQRRPDGALHARRLAEDARRGRRVVRQGRPPEPVARARRSRSST